MKPTKFILIGILASCVFAFLARTQSHPTDEPEELDYMTYGWRFYLRGATYEADVVRSNILSSPSWSPSEPLPLGPGQAVEIARKELNTLVKDGIAWYPKQIALRCVGHTAPQDAYRAWYYLIQFDPIHRTPSTNFPPQFESIDICVYLSGKAGTVMQVK